jgi:hypothetical protein
MAHNMAIDREGGGVSGEQVAGDNSFIRASYLDSEAPVAQQTDDEPAPSVGGIRLRMIRGTERHQAVEIEVRAALAALDDVVDLEGAPAATGLAPPAGAEESTGAPAAPDRCPARSLQSGRREAEHRDVANRKS